VLLHRRERNLYAPAARRLVDADYREVAPVNLHGVADLNLPLLLPDRVNNRLVARTDRASLDDARAREPRVALELYAVEHAHAEARVAGVRVLAHGDGGAHARQFRYLVGARDGQGEALRAAQADGAGGANHYLRADLRLAPAALAQHAVRQPDREGHEQDADGHAEHAHESASGAVCDVRQYKVVHNFA
jgi:hypothetical protein